MRKTFAEKTRIITPNGPGMQIFSPDGKYGYICSSFNPETDVVTVADHKIVAKVKQESPFCPNIAATPDGKQVWFTLKDTGKTQVFDAKPPFNLIKTIDTGPITNHVNFAHTAKGTFAYVTIGGLNEVKVFRTDDFSQVATIPVGNLPHGVWPSGDGSRIYVGLENDDALAAIDTATNKVIANIPIGQAPQAIAYVPNAAPDPDDRQNLQAARRRRPGRAPRARRRRIRRRGQAADQRLAVRSGPDPGAAGLGDRAGAEAEICACAGRSGRRQRSAAAARGLHDQSGRIGHRQCHRSDPADRQNPARHRTALSGHRSRRCRRSSATRSRFRPNDAIASG